MLEEDDLNSLKDKAFSPGIPYWYIVGTNSLSNFNTNSTLAIDLLDRMQKEGESDGVISFPDFLSNFSHGQLEGAKSSRPFKIQWVSNFLPALA